MNPYVFETKTGTYLIEEESSHWASIQLAYYLRDWELVEEVFNRTWMGIK